MRLADPMYFMIVGRNGRIEAKTARDHETGWAGTQRNSGHDMAVNRTRPNGVWGTLLGGIHENAGWRGTGLGDLGEVSTFGWGGGV
jgi:hypothetical protein